MRLIKLFTICTALITTVFTVAAAEPVKDTASVQKTLRCPTTPSPCRSSDWSTDTSRSSEEVSQ